MGRVGAVGQGVRRGLGGAVLARGHGEHVLSGLVPGAAHLDGVRGRVGDGDLGPRERGVALRDGRVALGVDLGEPHAAAHDVVCDRKAGTGVLLVKGARPTTNSLNFGIAVSAGLDLSKVYARVAHQVALGGLGLLDGEAADWEGDSTIVVVPVVTRNLVLVRQRGTNFPISTFLGLDYPGPIGARRELVDAVGGDALVELDRELRALRRRVALGVPVADLGALGVDLLDDKPNRVKETDGLSNDALRRPRVLAVDPARAGIPCIGGGVGLRLGKEGLACRGELAAVHRRRGVLGQDEPHGQLGDRLGVLASVALDGPTVACAAIAVVEDVVEGEAACDPAAEGLADPRRGEVTVGAIGDDTGVADELVARVHPHARGVGLDRRDGYGVGDGGCGIGGLRPKGGPEEAEHLAQDEDGREGERPEARPPLPMPVWGPRGPSVPFHPRLPSVRLNVPWTVARGPLALGACAKVGRIFSAQETRPLPLAGEGP